MFYIYSVIAVLGDNHTVNEADMDGEWEHTFFTLVGRGSQLRKYHSDVFTVNLSVKPRAGCFNTDRLRVIAFFSAISLIVCQKENKYISHKDL